MTDSATAQNSNGSLQLQEILRLQQILNRILPQLRQVLPKLVFHADGSSSSTSTRSEGDECSMAQWPSTQDTLFLLRLTSDAIGEKGDIRSFDALIELLKVLKHDLLEHWGDLSVEAKQDLLLLSQSIVSSFSNVATTRSRLAHTQESPLNRQRSISILLGYFKTAQLLIKNPSHTLKSLKQLKIFLPQFARTIQQLTDRERKLSELYHEPSREIDWDRDAQTQRNQGAIAWVQERMRKDALMTEAETAQATADFELFKEIVDSVRPSGNKLFSEE